MPAPAKPPGRAAASDDGFGDEPFPTAEQDVLGPAPETPDAEIEAIRAEGLTGRQLRTARRVAMKHGIEAASDHDAVRLLRRRGIDPFRPAAVLQLIERKPAEDAGTPRLPQTVPPPGLPATPPDDAARAREIMDIQRDIVRRRRRNFLMLLARLAAFVFLPTILAGWYYYRVATPLFATKTEFIIQQADAQVGGLGSMFRGTQFATSQDSIAVQGYLQSRDAMLRLDRDLGFKAHYAQGFIDPVQRLDPGASNEAAYRLYQRNVKIGYDPTEGLIKMEVIAADPAVSQSFAEALIGYAEEQVDQLSARLREDQMKGARDSFADAEAKVEAAQQKVLALQERLGVLDPMSESNAVMSQVATFEVELQKKRLELQQLLDNASPNKARVEGAKGDITRLEELIRNLRSQLTEGTASTASLAQVSGQLRIAEAELENRQLMLSQALQQLETARIEANRQVRYLETAVSPVAPDEPTYPRAFENTLLALLIFGGIYLMLSLTASILREQATA
ncbi:capsule biosynthesis protein [Albidovulum sp.]|uniref:capsule biosynthesis protein n=1 Tax=Albidovulum sp. TaxID=1872424 RepID=UPI0039B984BA